jgi:Family of unknown function (DUF6526)
MSQQNYRNHRRWVPLYHFLTLPLLFVMVIGSFVNLYKSAGTNFLSGSLICLGSIIMSSLYYHSRVFALKAQNRVIRMEENFRHFALTGKSLDPRLRLGQVIALRFAKDTEFVELARRAAEEGLSQDAIKKLIKDWKGDYHRV